MGYWWPPTPGGFDPVPRPLRWEGSRSSPVPSVEDCAIFGMGEGQFPGHLDPYGRPYASGTMTFGGTATNRPGRVPNYLRTNKTVSDRLDIYRRLIDLRTPEDPISGGLCADTIDYSSGSFTRHYWDFSDDTQPRRKRITYTPSGSDIKRKIEQWEGDWRPEGDDFEKGFIEAIPAIVAGFGAVTTIAIGYLTGNPALAGAWSNIFKVSGSAVFGGPAPSLEGFGSALVGMFGAAPDFGKVMGNMMSEKALKSGIYSEIGRINFAQLSEFGQDLSSHLDKLGAVAQKFAAAMPRIDLDLMTGFNLSTGALDAYAMLQGKAPETPLPEEIVRAFQNSMKGLSSFDLDSFGKAGFAWSLGLKQDLYYSIRKAAEDKSTFEATYAAMLAMKDKPIDPRTMITDDSDATATVAQVIARGKQSASVASSGNLSWRQALAQSKPSAPSKPSSDASDIALALLLAFAVYRYSR